MKIGRKFVLGIFADQRILLVRSCNVPNCIFVPAELIRLSTGNVTLTEGGVPGPAERRVSAAKRRDSPRTSWHRTMILNCLAIHGKSGGVQFGAGVTPYGRSHRLGALTRE